MANSPESSGVDENQDSPSETAPFAGERFPAFGTTNGTLSVRRAVCVGTAVVNGPVLLLLCVPLWLFGMLISQRMISRDYNWLGLPVLLVSFALAWLWWAVSLPRWRLWAYQRVGDIAALKRVAIAVGLTWPDDHLFGKTEIKSAAHARREQAFEQHLE
ncbi:MAG TPA: hypothetical protein PKN13_00230 [Accumulibacter sp.]|nr:hypothetical protein [Accumulibacter sp.]HMW16283.1 hypothetical protein [Accumulibacter sp.]HMX22164.1 hypothetical protein [Accumulibacter sp.]HNC16954.1 hypothetical protein [Accumulibacter sp.]HND79038.1 hypothetical protein [Accumulibacter sp.]